MTEKDADVIIIGAGLAGLSAAFELSEKRKKVLVIEKLSFIGGRTSSWIDKGMPVESGLHRFLGFYKALPELIERTGTKTDDIIFWEDEIEIITPDGGPRGVLGLAPLHKPLKTVAGLLGNNDLLNIKDKATLTKFFTIGLKDYAKDPLNLDKITVEKYAKKHGVTQNVINHFLTPLTSGLFFIPPSEYSMYAFMGLVGPYLPNILNARIGAFKGGMTEVMCIPIVKAIEKNGSKVLSGTGVDELLVEKNKVIGVKAKNKKFFAKEIILAASLKPAQDLISKKFEKNKWFKDMLKLSSMPAVTIQFELKKRSMPVDRATFGPGTSWGSFTEQSKTTFTHAKGRLSIILTPADRFLKMKEKDVLKIVIEDGLRLGIDLRDIIKDYRMTRIPYDFYALIPGSEKLRPSQNTPVESLTLAGDYTKQPYLSTMEGAVVSGKIASEIILK
jgi:15-cis-phytoene desaturase